MRTATIDSASVYMETLSRYPVLTSDKFDELIRLARKGDLEAKNAIVQGNLRFVVQIAAEYQTNALPFADLLAEGNIGLIKAVDKFDPELGYKFSTYAVWWIRNAIQRAIRHQSHPYRLPHNRLDDLSKLQNTADAMSQAVGRAVSTSEAAESLEINRNRRDHALRAQRSSVSMDGLTEDEERSLHNVIPDSQPLPDEELFAGEIADKLGCVMKDLNARDAEIITLTFGLTEDPMTLTQVGNRFGISKERVRQLRNRALEQLRTMLLGANSLSSAYL
jgi:RNA polymerase primary sigma factor